MTKEHEDNIYDSVKQYLEETPRPTYKIYPERVMAKQKATGEKIKIKIEGWVNVYQTQDGKIYNTTVIYETEAQARKQAGVGAVDCAFISQEAEVKTLKIEPPEDTPKELIKEG